MATGPGEIASNFPIRMYDRGGICNDLGTDNRAAREMIRYASSQQAPTILSRDYAAFQCK